VDRRKLAIWLSSMVIATSYSQLPLVSHVCGQDSSSGHETESPQVVIPDFNTVCDSQESCDSVGGYSCKNSIWTRDTLTGDWGGRRTALENAGIKFSGRSTHFGFGVDGGITNPPPIPQLGVGDVFKYTGRGEYDLTFDLEKFGGLPKGSLLVRGEHWYGDYANVSLRTGALPPAVFPGFLPIAPNDPGQLFLTNFVVTQPLSKEFVLYGGKVDVVGNLDQDDFAGGDGTNQFVNQAFVANPAFLLALPYSSITAGVVLPRDWGSMTTFVLDPQDRTMDFFDLGDIFSQGIIVGSELKIRTNFFGKKGKTHLGGIWKHVDLTDLRFNEPPPGVYPQPVVPGFPTRPDSFTLYAGGDQYVSSYDENRGWGVFTRASISDANPTPVQYFLSAGIGGFSPWAWERGDRFGIGWYHVGVSDEFGPLPRTLFAPRDGHGVEMFYSRQVTPWMSVTPDVQFIRPEISALANEAIVYGIRMNAVF
jgi:porin